MRAWKHGGTRGSTERLLRALQEEDTGDGVDWVIGFVSPLGVMTNSIHEIGVAAVPGKHLVLRGVDDREEEAALARNFDLSARERNDFLWRRQRHRQLVVFIHEWLHNLAAIHDSEPEAIMHPSYTHQQRGIDGANAHLAALALKAGVAARATGEAPDYAELRAYLAGDPSRTWYSADRTELLATLAERGGGHQPAPPGPAPAPAASGPAPAAPVGLGLRLPGLPGSDAPPELLGLRAAVQEGRWDQAIAGCLGAFPGEGAVSSWAAHLAELCARCGMIGLAEQRLGAGAPAESPARQAIGSARLRYGVAPGRLPLTPEVEAERARAWFAIRAALDAEQLDRADQALRLALQRFADDAGILSLRCEAAVRRDSSRDNPIAPCERALKAWSDLPTALYWSALAQANHGDRRVAVTRLLRARTLDPTSDGSWRVLADIYRVEGKRSELEVLRAEYQAQFGQQLK